MQSIIHKYIRKLNTFQQLMLDWCQHFALKGGRKDELTFIVQGPGQEGMSIEELHRDRCGDAHGSVASGRLERKGIKTHFKDVRSRRNSHLYGQVLPVGQTTLTISNDTCSNKLFFEKINSNDSCISCCPQPSPSRQNNILVPLPKWCVGYVGAIKVETATQMEDYRLQWHKQTKATNGEVQSYGQMMFLSKNMKSVDSYHLRRDNSYKYGQQHNEIQRSRASKGLDAGYSHKHKSMVGKVESEFELFPKEKFFNKFRLTPERKAILINRDTVISMQDYDSIDFDQSMRVEESTIFELDVRKLIQQIRPSILGDGFSLYIGVENTVNLIVTIKQFVLEEMNEISQQLMLHREIASHNVKVDSVLKLYQTQIDRNHYIFIKEAHTETLRQHMMNGGNGLTPKDVLEQVASIVDQMESFGLFLRRQMQLDDFVVCLAQVKLERVALFKIGIYHFASLDSILSPFYSSCRFRVK